MKLNCIEISINDEELGCQITFSEKKDLGEETANMSINEILESLGRYLLLQRSYPEDDFATGNYYFETHDENICGDLVNFEMVLSKTRFELKLPKDNIEISINPTEKEFKELIKILPILTNRKGKLLIISE